MKQKISLLNQKFFSLIGKSLLKSLMLLTAVLLTTFLSAQDTRRIQGKVIDEQNNPVIGATIVVKDAPITLEVPMCGNQHHFRPQFGLFRCFRKRIETIFFTIVRPIYDSTKLRKNF